MDTCAAHADLLGMGFGQPIERLSNTSNAGAAVHVIDTEGKCRHESWMRLRQNGR